MKKASRIFAVMALVSAVFGSATAYATGPYLGTAYKVINYPHGTRVVELTGETMDVHVEFARQKYEFIKQENLVGTYFVENGNNATAKLYVSPKGTKKHIKIMEFYGSKAEVQKKVESLKSCRYKISYEDESKCTGYKIM